MSASSRQQAAFNAYVGLGPTRSLTKLQAVLRTGPERHCLVRAPSIRTLEEWSSRFDWIEQVRVLERQAAEQDQQEHIRQISEYRARLRDEGLQLQQLGVAWLSTKDADHVRASEAVRAIAEGFRLEALGLGDVTERIGVQDDHAEFIQRLRDDELDRLVEILNAATPPAADGTGTASPE